MGRFRIAALVSACLLLVACGGTTKQSIRGATANRLASASHAVALALQRGDSCGAATKARALRRQVAGAIASGAIPGSLAASARTTSSHLASSIVCTPAPPPPAGPRPVTVTCPQIAARKQALEQEKHSGDKHKKDPGEADGRHQIDEQEHALDQRGTRCK
jgi:hypothetical protein